MKLAIATTLALTTLSFGGNVHAQAQGSPSDVVASTRLVTSIYPEAPTRAAPEPVSRACTQLEMGAGIAAEDCGHVTLSEVAEAYIRATSSPN